MKTLFVLVAVLFGAVSAVPVFDGELNDIWESFKSTHSKTYSASEENVR